MKKILFCLFAFIVELGCCSCGDDNESDVTKVPAPQVVSTTPAEGTTDVAAGIVSVTVSYDQNIVFLTANTGLLQIGGGNITSALAQGKNLNITANCPDEGTRVSITIPKGAVKNTQGTEAEAFTLTFTTKTTPQPDPDVPDGFETAAQAVLNMTPGWNLGNTLESHGQWIVDYSARTTADFETAWGQPVTDAHLMAAVKEKGFRGMRIPVTWYQHMDESGKVDAAWMNRVQEVVDYAINAGLYCILNVHHDTGAHDDAWVRASSSSYSQSHERFEYLWQQIAERFADYDEHLLFEGYNEMLDNNFQWNEPRLLSDLQCVNSFAQSFVNAVRATGGKNLHRNLVVSTYAGAHGNNVLAGLTVPSDPCGNQNHLAVEVHSYDPWDWVNRYNMTWTAECRREIENMFADLNNHFIANGYPVIVGEYGSNGADEKTINKDSTPAQKAEAGRQAADMNRLCLRYGAASFYWMLLIDGQDRSEATFKWSMEQVADSIVKVYR